MSTAFEVTADDIETVLRTYWAQVGDTQGKSFADMAEELLLDLDTFWIEQAALAGDTLDEQIQYAYDEIRTALVERGILKS